MYCLSVEDDGMVSSREKLNEIQFLFEKSKLRQTDYFRRYEYQ